MSQQDDGSPAALVHVGVPVETRTKRPKRKLLLSFGVVILVCVLMLVWIMQTQVGSRFFLQSLGNNLSGGRISVGEVHGRLADQLQIDEIVYRDAQEKISLSGVQLIWQPWSLIRGHVDISVLTISTLRVASVPTNKVASMPANLQLPVPTTIKQVAIGRIVLSELSPDGQELKPIELKSIVGSLKLSGSEHQITVKLDSAWGGVHLQSQTQTSRPFQTTGEFTYQGQVKEDLPKVLIQGSLSGSLQDLLVQATSVAKSRDGILADPKQLVSADMQVRLAPFSSDPLRAIALKVSKLNPQWIHQQAPSAMLEIDVNLQPGASPATLKNAEKLAGTGLSGDIRIRNSAPQTLDKHGLPFKSLESKIDWQGELLTLGKTKIELLAGSILADSKLQFRKAKLPLMDARLSLKELNLAQLDSRLRQSRIQGAMQLQAKEQQRLDFQAQLKEPRASLDADASFLLNRAGTSGLLQLKRFELQAEQARLSGNAEVNFEGNQAFMLQAKMTQFDPAHWWLAPSGKLNGEVNLIGTMAGKPTVKMQLSGLFGELSGQQFSASGQAEWQQATSLKLDQFVAQWGANKLSANGVLGATQNQLQVNLQADDLALFESLTGFSLTGTARLNGVVSGKLDALAATVNLHAEDLRSARGFAIAQLDGDLQLGADANDPLTLQLLAKGVNSAGIALSPTEKNNRGLPIEKRKTLLDQLQVSINGTRSNHKIAANAQFEKMQQVVLVAQGGITQIPSARDQRVVSIEEGSAWSGQLEQLKVSGFGNKISSQMPMDDMVLQAPMTLGLSGKKINVGSTRLVGGFGKLALDYLEWTPRSISSKAKWDEFPVMEIVKSIRPQENIQGDLRLGLHWDLQLKDNVRGELNIQRQSGDLSVQDADGTGQPMALGLSDLQMQLQAGGLIAGSDAERIRVQLNGLGTRLGQWKAKFETQIHKVNDKWTLHSEAPVNGELHATTSELQWLAGQVSSDFAVKGTLKLDANFGGKFSKPTYQATLEGRGLELAFASEGLLFPNGELRAQLNQDILKLELLKFSNTINFVPKLEQLQDVNWIGREGIFSAIGEVNWRTQTGAIQADWKNFPLLQRKDRWLVVSGQASITQVDSVWALIGQLRADAAYFKLPKLPPPSLSSDVLVSKGIKLIDEDIALDEGKKGLKTKLDLQIDMGPRFVFVGRGLDTALAGTLRLRSNNGSPVHASGSITTNGGQYEGYGQQLEIERGILNFQGAPSNPALNIRALRKGLAVEAGVDVTGTVANPQVRLVSEPNVPDSEKISWLVLGRESDQVGTADASLLLSAAGAIFGNDGSRNIPRELVQGLGFDEFSIGPAENGGASKLPGQTVAGAISVGASSNDKVVTIGKRLKPGLVLSFERGLSDASGAMKISWQLSQRVRLIGRSGTDNSADVKYSFSFN
ncbi:translocation/assembly module TamB domain-containing protein [Undibacterium sp.]|uniref:translocation/assembly module TamB domain-containing protein n=1 Tax=Undibacterium sp. TaxID=1914977 RepID=UPI0037532BE8